MATRLTTNQEIAGSTPAMVMDIFLQVSHPCRGNPIDSHDDRFCALSGISQCFDATLPSQTPDHCSRRTFTRPLPDDMGCPSSGARNRITSFLTGMLVSARYVKA